MYKITMQKEILLFITNVIQILKYSFDLIKTNPKRMIEKLND